MDYTYQDVRVFVNVAIVTGTGHRVGSFDGKAFDRRFRYSHSYVRRDGVWRMVFGQNMPLTTAQ